MSAWHSDGAGSLQSSQVKEAGTLKGASGGQRAQVTTMGRYQATTGVVPVALRGYSRLLVRPPKGFARALSTFALATPLTGDQASRCVPLGRDETTGLRCKKSNPPEGARHLAVVPVARGRDLRGAANVDEHFAPGVVLGLDHESGSPITVHQVRPKHETRWSRRIALATQAHIPTSMPTRCCGTSRAPSLSACFAANLSCTRASAAHTSTLQVVSGPVMQGGHGREGGAPFGGGDVLALRLLLLSYTRPALLPVNLPQQLLHSACSNFRPTPALGPQAPRHCISIGTKDRRLRCLLSLYL